MFRLSAEPEAVRDPTLTAPDPSGSATAGLSAHKYTVYNNLFEQDAPQRSVTPAAPWIMVTQASNVAPSFAGSPIHPGSPQQPASPTSLVLDDLGSDMREPGVIMGSSTHPAGPLGEGTEPTRPHSAPHQAKGQMLKSSKVFRKYPEGKGEARLGSLKEAEAFQFNTSMTTFTSIDLPKRDHCSAHASGPVPSEKLPDVPTASGALDPGAYHQANAMLRRQFPHYHVRTCLALHA